VLESPERVRSGKDLSHGPPAVLLHAERVAEVRPSHLLQETEPSRAFVRRLLGVVPGDAAKGVLGSKQSEQAIGPWA